MRQQYDKRYMFTLYHTPFRSVFPSLINYNTSIRLSAHVQYHSAGLQNGFIKTLDPNG